MARIVNEVSDRNKHLVLALKQLAELIAKIEERSSGGKSIDYANIEREVGAAAAAIEREAHRGLLAGLDIDAEKVRVGGGLYTRVGRHEATYYTMAGPVVVERSLYRRDGERNSKVVDAISLRTGVVADGWLPQTARAMAHHVQRGTAREAEASAVETGRLVYSRSSFDRVAHAVGDLYGDRNDEIEDALITAYEPPEETSQRQRGAGSCIDADASAPLMRTPYGANVERCSSSRFEHCVMKTLIRCSRRARRRSTRGFAAADA